MIIKLDTSFKDCELKFSDKSTGEFSGYGSVFNSVDNGGDTIRKGAFEKAINNGMPKMFINHDHFQIPPGDWLSAKEDDHGLLLEGKIDMNHRDGPSLLSAMKREAMTGLSIGVVRSTLKFTMKEEGGRDISEAELKEVSVVTFPMEESAQIMSVKTEIESITCLKDAELLLRESGVFPRSMATAFVGQFKRICQSESGAALKEQITELEAKLKEYELRLGVQKGTRQLVHAINNLKFRS